VPINSTLIARAFWALFALEAIVLVAGVIWVTYDKGSWGPEGPVGAWIIYLAPPIFLGIPLAIVLIGRSPRATLTGLIFLAWPLIPLAIGPLYGMLDNAASDHRVSGDFNFFWPSQRNLAHALRAHDSARVKELLPRAGDLNALHWGESLFGFGLKNLDQSPASTEIVRAMLDQGGDPNRPLSANYWPLSAVIGAGPATTKVLLDAGANPNRLENTGRPVWWNVLYHDSAETLQTLAILLDHGADLTMRDGDLGPVGWAAYQKNWPAVWLMMERGAPWENELALGQPVVDVLTSELASLRARHSAIPQEMEKILAKYRAKTPRP
jgi:hypothetical protein